VHNDVIAFPVRALTDDSTPVTSLLGGDFRLDLVLKLSSTEATWTPLITGGYDADMSTISTNLSSVDNGLYDLGIKVTCHGESFISDMTKGLIDRQLPQVVTTFPVNGASVDSSQGIQAVFDEPLNCQRTSATYSIDQVDFDVALSCTGETVDILFDSTQVDSNVVYIHYAM
jgi:hypothetical protein